MIDTALQYSGGKDSRVILHMMREQLDKILVVWVDPGAAYPQMRREMEQMPRKVPHFLIVRGNQPKQIAENGYPSDVVPINFTRFGRAMVKGAPGVKIQSAFDCCSANMWQPLRAAMALLGIKKIIRGQRRAEKYTNSAVTNGAIVDGVEYVLPIEDWNDDHVFSYLQSNQIAIPDYYKTEGTSHDCWNCTAYLASYTSRIKNLPQPQRAEVHRRLEQIRAAVELETSPLNDILKAD